VKHGFGPVICLVLAAGLVVFALTKRVERREEMMVGASEAATDGEGQGTTEAKPVFLRGRRLNVNPVGRADARRI